MKKRLTASGLVLSALLGAALVAALPADAATTKVGGVPVTDGATTWAAASDISAITQAVPSGWAVSNPPPVEDANGLQLTGGELLLRGVDGTVPSDLARIHGGTAGGTSGTPFMYEASGPAHYVLLINRAGSDSDPDLVVLYSTGTTPSAVDGTWTTDVTIGAIPPNTPRTLAELQEQLTMSSPAATLSAYGVGTDDSERATLSDITFGPQRAYFTPRPVGVLTAAGTVTPELLQGMGVEITASGFRPGEPVAATLLDDSGTRSKATRGYVADTNGEVHVTVAFPSNLKPGPARVLLTGQQSAVAVAFPLTINESNSSSTPTPPGARPSGPETPPATMTPRGPDGEPSSFPTGTGLSFTG